MSTSQLGQHVLQHRELHAASHDLVHPADDASDVGDVARGGGGGSCIRWIGRCVALISTHGGGCGGDSLLCCRRRCLGTLFGQRTRRTADRLREREKQRPSPLKDPSVIRSKERVYARITKPVFGFHRVYTRWNRLDELIMNMAGNKFYLRPKSKSKTLPDSSSNFGKRQSPLPNKCGASIL